MRTLLRIVRLRIMAVCVRLSCNRRFLLKARYFRLDRKCRPGATLSLSGHLALVWHARSIFSDRSLMGVTSPHFCCGVFRAPDRPPRSTGNAHLPRSHRLTPRQIRHLTVLPTSTAQISIAIETCSSISSSPDVPGKGNGSAPHPPDPGSCVSRISPALNAR